MQHQVDCKQGVSFISIHFPPPNLNPVLLIATNHLPRDRDMGSPSVPRQYFPVIHTRAPTLETDASLESCLFFSQSTLSFTYSLVWVSRARLSHFVQTQTWFTQKLALLDSLWLANSRLGQVDDHTATLREIKHRGMSQSKSCQMCYVQDATGIITK